MYLNDISKYHPTNPAAASSLSEKGIYAIAQGYGALPVRVLLAPIEEMARVRFCKNDSVMTTEEEESNDADGKKDKNKETTKRTKERKEEIKETCK